MKKENIIKIGIIIIILLIVVGIVVYKRNITKENQLDKKNEVGQVTEEKLPTLLEFGSKTCMPCLTMEPIIASITEKYEGKLNVKFIDVYKDYKTPQKYTIGIIPTQVFLDKDQNVVYRHEGILYEDEIISKLKEMGIE